MPAAVGRWMWIDGGELQAENRAILQV